VEDITSCGRSIRQAPTHGRPLRFYAGQEIPGFIDVGSHVVGAEGRDCVLLPIGFSGQITKHTHRLFADSIRSGYARRWDHRDMDLRGAMDRKVYRM
jgi:hypothetical protein